MAEKADKIIASYPKVQNHELGQQMYRKASKLLAKSKYVSSKDGT